MTMNNDNGKHNGPLRKLIDIPDSILDDLRTLARAAGKPLKNYIEDLLVERVHKANFQNRNNGDSFLDKTG